MASENVDLVRRIYESFLSRDTEAARSFVHPDIEWDMRELGVPGLNNLYSGLEGVDEFYRQWLDAWTSSISTWRTRSSCATVGSWS